ncbi:MAG: acyl carrier protein [Bacteroidota bacterium]|nr:acyl carrier protein [Bacteroidota bacterium]
MEKETVLIKVTEILRQVFKNPSLVITDQTTAHDVDGWDSLSHMILITDVEKAFGIKFRLKELNKMRNVGDMVDLIIQKST